MEKETLISLAPLAGYTDSVFRDLCLENGADTVTTEMISAKGIVYGSEKTESLCRGSDRGVCYIQLFGHEPDIMAEAVSHILDNHACAGIDLNMGCPVKKIVSNGDGSALMQNEELAAHVAGAAVRAAEKYGKKVSVKIRAGFSESEKNASSLAKKLEEAGVSFLTVHGRTRNQMYSGKSDPGIIKEVKDSVKIPVIANGDVTDGESAVKLLDITGADGVSVGRGALGNPFIFREIKEYIKTGKEIPARPDKRIVAALTHLRKEAQLQGEQRAVRAMRSHLAFYVKGIRGASVIRGRLTSIESVREAEGILAELLENLEY